ncbi:MAG: undecaprenyldiphospho-muramoylpentapeptide beta-N-acetylglucosaminyltransferase [Alphaproteobacteria bacterium]|nr:undecaprenyldiphospho-muramoylpentapeptide beta-N-acetylglucosaminyltransferase [Alphaproteobacteria bacterium]
MSRHENTSQRTVVLAAGGTGGHIFPAQALAEELISRGVHVVLITDKRFEKYTSAFNGVEVRIIRSGSMSGGVIRRALSVGNILLGIRQSRKFLQELKPVAVVGFGGYPSFPTMIAASWLKLYTLVHEQNSVLGRANRILAKRISKIATSFAHTSHVPEEAQEKMVFTGNPVRLGIKALHDVPYPELTEDGKIYLLIMGGSQGATVFSKIVPEAISLLPPALRSRLRLDQQCRPADLDAVREKYAEMDVNANCAIFFNDVPARLASAHLVIGRAGASTVAELLVAGRPAVLVPYPAAMDDHQRYNANTVEDAGAGWLMPEEGFTAAALSDKLEHFLTLPSTLTKAAENARAAGHPEAAHLLSQLVLQEPLDKILPVLHTPEAPAEPLKLTYDAAPTRDVAEENAA